MQEKFILPNNNFLLLGKTLLILLIINIKPASAQDTLNTAYSLNARGSFKAGRLDQTNISVDGNLKFEKRKWALDLLTTYKYLKTNGNVGENELLGRALLSLYPKNKLYPVLGNLFYRSEFYQIANRNIPGIGAGYRLLQKEKNNISISCWLAYDKTVFENIPTYETFRINSFLSGNYELIKNKLSTQFVFYYLQSLEENTNFIWRLEPSLLYALSKRLSLSLNYRNHFENIIDPSNEKQNTALTIGIQLQNK